MNMHANVIPAADRVVTIADNESPEKLPMPLAPAEDLPTIMKKDLDEVTTTAVFELSTYSRVPAEIGDDDVYQRVVTLATQIKAVVDDLDGRRSTHKAPYLAAGRVIDDQFKLSYRAPDAAPETANRLLKSELEAAHKSLKSRLSAYDTKKHREEQTRIAEEQALVAAAAAADGIEMSAAAPAAQAPGTLKSAHGGSAIRKITKVWKVTDLDQVPRSLLMPDPVAIQALIDNGAKAIPGIEIEEVVDTHTQRTKS